MTMEVAMSRSLSKGRYFGAIGGQVRCAAGAASRVLHAVHRELPEHEHALAYFCMLAAGDYVERAGGRELRYGLFEVGFHPARMPHRDAVGVHGGEFLCLEVDATALLRNDVRLRADPALLPGDVSLQMLRIHHALGCGTLDALELESAVWHLCGDASRERPVIERSAPRWLRRCMDRIAQAYADPLTIEAIAHDVGVHPVHVSREFRRRHGQTLGEYVNKVRIRAACAAMNRASRPLAQIALDAGFADQPHFCRVFKAALGCTPSSFRKAVDSGRAATSRIQRTMREESSAL